MKRNILIVDQEHEFTVNLREELEKRHCKVFIACERVKAQEIVWERKPHLIVLGAIMPRGDAFKLHQWLKKTPATSDLPIVVVDVPPEKQSVSGWRRDEGLRLEAEDYFCRPVDLTALVSVIEKLLDKTTRKILLVADDHAVIRNELRPGEPAKRYAHVGGHRRAGGRKTLQLTPNVVLMDIVMPVLNGIEAMKQITSRCKDVKVLILSQYDDEGNITASKQAGAFDFIPKKSVSTELLKAIRTAKRSKYRARYSS